MSFTNLPENIGKQGKNKTDIIIDISSRDTLAGDEC